jgi:hypothetical protein
MVLAGIVVIEGSQPWRCAVRLSFRTVAAYRSGKTPNSAAQSLRKLASAGNGDRLANDPEIIAQGVVASSRQAA